MSEAKIEALAAPAARPRRVWVSRIVWFVLFATPLGVFVTAAQLTPDPAGMGTHTQLGLPPCGFLAVTGVPCPGCGLTTCFAHMIRLQIWDAAGANLFGVALFLGSFAAMVVSAVGLFRGLPVMDTLERLHIEKWAIALSLLAIGVWGVRVAAHLL